MHLHRFGDPRSSPPPRQLPPSTTRFVHRSAELAKLDLLLGDTPRRSTAIAVVSGEQGVGKTALALHWARRAGLPDGELYADMHPGNATPSDAADVLTRFLHALGVPPDNVPADHAERAAQFRSMTHDRRMLVMLDNARPDDEITQLLPGSPTCVAIVTSRDKLSDVMTHLGEIRIILDVLPLDESVDWLRHVVGPERIDAEVAAARELASLCGGLPRILRFVADQLMCSPGSTIADLTGELADRRRLLRTLATVAAGDELTDLAAMLLSTDRVHAMDSGHKCRSPVGELIRAFIHMHLLVGDDRHLSHSDLLRDYADTLATFGRADSSSPHESGPQD